MNIVEHYNAERIPNPNPKGSTSYSTFDKVRKSLLTASRKYGAAGPDDELLDYVSSPDGNPYDLYIIDDQYNDELYQYAEVYNRNILSPAWLKDMMSALRRFPGWAIGIKNIRFAYLIIFSDKLMVTGYPFSGCNDIESIAAAASANLWGVNGEEDPFVNELFNRKAVLESPICGCYYCCAMFPPSEIVNWKDENHEGIPQTAICPRCSECKVLTPKPSVTMRPEALLQISELAFGPISERKLKEQ